MSKRINILLSDEEYDMLQGIVDELHCSKSAFLRHLIRSYYQNVIMKPEPLAKNFMNPPES